MGCPNDHSLRVDGSRVMRIALAVESPTVMAEHLEGEVGRSFFPDEVGVEVVIGRAERDESVGREAALRRGGVEVHELVRADRMLGNADGAFPDSARGGTGQPEAALGALGGLEVGLQRAHPLQHGRTGEASRIFFMRPTSSGVVRRTDGRSPSFASLFSSHFVSPRSAS